MSPEPAGSWSPERISHSTRSPPLQKLRVLGFVGVPAPPHRRLVELVCPHPSGSTRETRQASPKSAGPGSTWSSDSERPSNVGDLFGSSKSSTGLARPAPQICRRRQVPLGTPLAVAFSVGRSAPRLQLCGKGRGEPRNYPHGSTLELRSRPPRPGSSGEPAGQELGENKQTNKQNAHFPSPAIFPCFRKTSQKNPSAA